MKSVPLSLFENVVVVLGGGGGLKYVEMTTLINKMLTLFVIKFTRYLFIGKMKRYPEILHISRRDCQGAC